MSHDTASRQAPEREAVPIEQALSLLQQGARSLQSQPEPRRRGRPAQIGWAQMCAGILCCLLQGWRHQRDLWRLLCEPEQGVLVTDQAIYNRLTRAGAWMQRWFEDLSGWLRSQLEPWQERELASFARQVLALDESTLERLARWLPGLRPLQASDPALLAGRLCGLFDVRLQQWARVEMLQPAQANCKVFARAMLEGLEEGTLLLWDRGYFSFAWVDELSARRLWWVSRYANKASYRVRHICYQGNGVLDAIVQLGAYRADRAREPVRLVSLWIKGRQHVYLTNVLDPRLLSVAQIVQLYGRRWDIELAFRVLKDALGINQPWSARWAVVQVQIWAGLILAQGLHASQRQIAVQAGVEPAEVSIEVLVRLSRTRLGRQGAFLEQAVRWGRAWHLIRPSSRLVRQVPWIDPAWVTPPPDGACCPRADPRYARRKCGSRRAC